MNEKLTSEQRTEKLPNKHTVPCYWCELEVENKGWNIPPHNNAVCVAKEPFEGKYACDRHADLLLIAGWYGELLPHTVYCQKCGKKLEVEQEQEASDG